jgi:hypothetical protein
MVRKAVFVAIIGFLVAVLGVASLHKRLPIGPVVLVLGLIPMAGLVLARRSVRGASADLIFGAVDTGLLAVAAISGGVLFGVAGAIAGGVIGDSLTDAVAGFAEGEVAQWLAAKGIRASREPVTTSLGKMAGCLLGSGLILTCGYCLGVSPAFP